MARQIVTPIEYATDATDTEVPAQPAGQQPQRTPGSTTTINMVAQRLPPLAALPGDSNDHGEGAQPLTEPHPTHRPAEGGLPIHHLWQNVAGHA